VLQVRQAGPTSYVSHAFLPSLEALGVADSLELEVMAGLKKFHAVRG
jgi:hypothetical protein